MCARIVVINSNSLLRALTTGLFSLQTLQRGFLSREFAIFSFLGRNMFATTWKEDNDDQGDTKQNDTIDYSCRPNQAGYSYLTIGQDLFSIENYILEQYNASLHRNGRQEE